MNELLKKENAMRYLRIDDEKEGPMLEGFLDAAIAYAKAYQKQAWEDGLPEYAQIACLLAVGQWWEHRDGLADGGAMELPHGAKRLLDLDRVRMIGGG